MLYAGLDVSNATTRICVVEPSGTIVREGKAASEPEAIAAFLGATGRPFTRVGLEAGALAEWIHAGLAELGLPVVCLETRHLHATLSAQPVKTDRNDARGIAQVVRVGWFKPVHAKTAQAQKLRALVVARKGLVRELAGTEQLVRGLLRPFGLKVGPAVRRRFAERVRELVGGKPVLAQVAEALLEAHRVLVEQVHALQRLSSSRRCGAILCADA